MTRVDAIPAELREREQWLVWRSERNADSRLTKVPYRPASPRVLASTTVPATWGTFDQACAVEDADGIGFVFTADDLFTGWDLDGCVDEHGNLHPAALAIVRYLHGYTEHSPSGCGLHVIVEAELHSDRHMTYDVPWTGKLEVYDRARFFTVTGQGEGEPGDSQRESEQLVGLWLPSRPTSRRAARGEKAPTPIPALTLADTELLARARAARNGAKFSALYDRGDVSGYPSKSQADLTLCLILAFRRCDAAQIERLWLSSALTGGKAKRHSYRARTAQKARELAAAQRRAIACPTAYLLAAHKAGELEPVKVTLALPADASEAMRLIATDLALLLGLRRAAGDASSQPYSIRYAAERTGVKRTSSERALAKLCKAGTFIRAESLPSRGPWPRGTITYDLPVGAVASASDGEPAPVLVEGVVDARAEPVAEGVDEPLVAETVDVHGESASPDHRIAEERAVEGLVTAGNRARRRRVDECIAVHANDGTAATGVKRSGAKR